MSAINYNFATTEELLTQVGKLSSFEDVQNWDKNAQLEMQNINQTLYNLTNTSTEIEQKLSEALSSHSSKPFFKKMFASDKESGSYKTQLLQIQNLQQKLESNKTRLEHWIATTPDDESEAKQMLAELKLGKKELNILKKELRAEIKEINTSARTKNANISNQFVFSNPKLKQIQRASVRGAKENALKPHESQMAELESQLIEIDKMIAWIERIRF